MGPHINQTPHGAPETASASASAMIGIDRSTFMATPISLPLTKNEHKAGHCAHQKRQPAEQEQPGDAQPNKAEA